MVDEVYRETELLETGRQVGSAIQPGIQFYGDTGLLKQALRILVDNAVKYTPGGRRPVRPTPGERRHSRAVRQRHRPRHRPG